MRKSIILAWVAIFFCTSLLAQTLQEVRDLAGKSQWDKAKETIDKYLENDKNNKKGEGWYLKAVVYNAIARDPKFSGLATDPRMESFNAYKKYLELDKDAFEGKLNQHSTLFDVSFGYLQKASEDFNTKKYLESLNSFRNAEVVQNYIVSKNFTYNDFAYPVFDTQLYVNIAAAAINSKKDDIAIEYYAKIAEKKINVKGYDEIYRYLVDYYDRKGDKAMRNKYLALGKEVFPADDFWCQVGLAEVWDDKPKLFVKFDELINGGCGNYVNNYNYAVELYNYAFASQTRPADFAKVEVKIPAILKKAIEQNPTVEANMLMARYHFGHINDLLDSINAVKGTKPADIAKRKELNTRLDKWYDEMLPYAKSAWNTLNDKPVLKTGEKGSFKIVSSMLSEYYERKGDKVKVKEYQDKMKTIQ
jgi:hypothetical protein